MKWPVSHLPCLNALILNLQDLTFICQVDGICALIWLQALPILESDPVLADDIEFPLYETRNMSFSVTLGGVDLTVNIMKETLRMIYGSTVQIDEAGMVSNKLNINIPVFLCKTSVNSL